MPSLGFNDVASDTDMRIGYTAYIPEEMSFGSRLGFYPRLAIRFYVNNDVSQDFWESGAPGSGYLFAAMSAF